MAGGGASGGGGGAAGGGSSGDVGRRQVSSASPSYADDLCVASTLHASFIISLANRTLDVFFLIPLEPAVSSLFFSLQIPLCSRPRSRLSDSRATDVGSCI